MAARKGYVVKYGDEVLCQPGDLNRVIYDPKIKLGVDSISTFSFTIPPTHPLRDSATVYDNDNRITVEFDGASVFSGFITRMSETMNTELVVTCNDWLAILGMFHVVIDNHPQLNGNRRTYRASELVDEVRAKYNAIVNPTGWPPIKSLRKGQVDDVGRYDPVKKLNVVDVSATTPTTALEVLRKSIAEPYDCRITVTTGEFGNTQEINILKIGTSSPKQTISFGENLTDFVADIDTSEMYNACIPIGASRRDYTGISGKTVIVNYVSTGAQQQGYFNLSVSSGTYEVEKGDILVIGEDYMAFDANSTLTTGRTPTHTDGGTRDDLPDGTKGLVIKRSNDTSVTSSVTLERLSDGTYGDYEKKGIVIYDEDAVERYGLRTYTFSDSDVLYTDELLERAIAEIETKKEPSYTLEINGVDMAMYASGYQHLVAGDTVRVVSEPHGVDTVMLVASIDINLDDPSATKFTLGPIASTATNKIAIARAGATDVRDMVAYDRNDIITARQIWRLQ